MRRRIRQSFREACRAGKRADASRGRQNAPDAGAETERLARNRASIAWKSKRVRPAFFRCPENCAKRGHGVRRICRRLQSAWAVREARRRRNPYAHAEIGLRSAHMPAHKAHHEAAAGQRRATAPDAPLHPVRENPAYSRHRRQASLSRVGRGCPKGRRLPAQERADADVLCRKAGCVRGREDRANAQSSGAQSHIKASAKSGASACRLKKAAGISATAQTAQAVGDFAPLGKRMRISGERASQCAKSALKERTAQTGRSDRRTSASGSRRG